MAAFLDSAEGGGAQIIVPVVAHAVPSGPVSNAAFEYVAKAVCPAVREGCDAVMLDCGVNY